MHLLHETKSSEATAHATSDYDAALEKTAGLLFIKDWIGTKYKKKKILTIYMAVTTSSTSRRS